MRHLRPTAFMEARLPTCRTAYLETGKVTLFGKGENPRNFVAAADVAHFAVLMLLKPEASEDVLEIGGPENFTNMRVVGMYEELAGRKAKVSHVPLGMLRIMSPVSGLNPGLSRIAGNQYLVLTRQTKPSIERLAAAVSADVNRLAAGWQRMCPAFFPAAEQL
ncbi:MAG: NAD-dependent epimerase/dehydratase family protein [bacterium]|nr:NAD-dependent epimerase/dehydratase family protein [bacterium]